MRDTSQTGAPLRRILREEMVTYYEETRGGERAIRKETVVRTFFADNSTRHNPNITTSVEYL